MNVDHVDIYVDHVPFSKPLVLHIFFLCLPMFTGKSASFQLSTEATIMMILYTYWGIERLTASD